MLRIICLYNFRDLLVQWHLCNSIPFSIFMVLTLLLIHKRLDYALRNKKMEGNAPRLITKIAMLFFRIPTGNSGRFFLDGLNCKKMKKEDLRQYVVFLQYVENDELKEHKSILSNSAFFHFYSFRIYGYRAKDTLLLSVHALSYNQTYIFAAMHFKSPLLLCTHSSLFHFLSC